MPADHIARANAELRHRPALDIVKWAVAQAAGRAIVSTNFRPHEAVILHLCAQAQPEIPVLWVDHGYNRPATYRHAEQLKKRLNLNLKPYLPRITPAHRDAVYGEVPALDDEKGLKQFSAVMKLEPFQRGMKELAPKELHGRAFGVYHGVLGAMAIPSGLLTGLLWQQFGPAAALGVGRVALDAADIADADLSGVGGDDHVGGLA